MCSEHTFIYSIYLGVSKPQEGRCYYLYFVNYETKACRCLVSPEVTHTEGRRAEVPSQACLPLAPGEHSEGSAVTWLALPQPSLLSPALCVGAGGGGGLGQGGAGHWEAQLSFDRQGRPCPGRVVRAGYPGLRAGGPSVGLAPPGSTPGPTCAAGLRSSVLPSGSTSLPCGLSPTGPHPHILLSTFPACRHQLPAPEGREVCCRG